MLKICEVKPPLYNGRMEDRIGIRIKKARVEKGLSQQDLALAVGVSRAAISQWESGETKRLDAEHLIKAAKALDTDPQWLLEGGPRIVTTAGSMRATPESISRLKPRIIDLDNSPSNRHAYIKTDQPLTEAARRMLSPLEITSPEQDHVKTVEELFPPVGESQTSKANIPNEDEQARILANDFVLVPRFDVKASMGTGQLVEQENVVDLLAFKRNWVQVELGVDPKNLALISTIGDSMEPSLRPGDLVLIDRSVTAVRSDSVYVINFDGELMAKRIQKMFDGSLVIKSDNPAYAPQTLTPEQAERLRIVGRVVWAGRRM